MEKPLVATDLPSWITADWLKSFRRKLITWYRRDGRDLPWRNTDDPYHVLVSEIMLQQTQISTVIPYYRRFLDHYPNPRALAQAPLADVLAIWEGLGYYRRARSLHNAAQMIVQKYGGEFPTDFDKILALPGVGRYTAGAVASFALGQRHPIVEANTQRLYARLLHLDADLQLASSQRLLWEFAKSILPQSDAGTVNHAVMDLGSMICKPKSPSCLICPLKELCPTFSNHTQEIIPAPARKKSFVDQFEIAVSLRDADGRVFVARRPDSGWWAGMWDLPRMSCQKGEWDDRTTFEGWFRCQFGFECRLLDCRGIFRYAVTHHRIECRLFEGYLENSRQKHQVFARNGKPKAIGVRRTTAKAVPKVDDFAEISVKWASENELAALPFNSSGRKMLDSILKNG